MLTVEAIQDQVKNLTVQEAMQVAGVSRPTLMHRLHNGQIAATRHGRAWSIPVIYDQDGVAHFLSRARIDKTVKK